MKRGIVRLSGILGALFGVAAAVCSALFPAQRLVPGLLSVLGLVGLSLFFYFHFEAFRAFSRRRSTQLGLNSALMVIMVLFIIVVFNLMIRQYYFRVDLSSTARYSLAPQTRTVVRNLDRDVTITVFGQEKSPGFRRAAELLEGYRYLNRRIAWTVLDLDRAPIKAQEYGVNRYDSIVVQAGEKVVVEQGIDEPTITNAIIKATRKSGSAVVFLAGHGERRIDVADRSGMSKAASRLRSIGYRVSALTLTAAESIPGDSSLVIMAGPRQQYGDDMLRKLDAYLSRGGAVLAMLDPGHGLPAVTRSRGLDLMQGEIIDARSNLGGRDPKTPLVSAYPDSPVTRGAGVTTFFPGAAPVATGASGREYGYMTIVTASPSAEIVNAGRTIRPKEPPVIAAASGSKAGRDVMILFGDSDFASNAFFDIEGNGDLFVNCVNWLAGETELISIAPRTTEFIPIYLTQGQAAVVLYGAVFMLPASVFIAGFGVWLRRGRL
jgi:hypothetical protein